VSHWVVLISVSVALIQTPATDIGLVHCVMCLFTSQPLGQYQIILLADRGTWVWITCPLYCAETRTCDHSYSQIWSDYLLQLCSVNCFNKDLSIYDNWLCESPCYHLLQYIMMDWVVEVLWEWSPLLDEQRKEQLQQYQYISWKTKGILHFIFTKPSRLWTILDEKIIKLLPTSHA